MARRLTAGEIRVLAKEIVRLTVKKVNEVNKRITDSEAYKNFEHNFKTSLTGEAIRESYDWMNKAVKSYSERASVDMKSLYSNPLNSIMSFEEKAIRDIKEKEFPQFDYKFIFDGKADYEYFDSFNETLIRKFTEELTLKQLTTDSDLVISRSLIDERVKEIEKFIEDWYSSQYGHNEKEKSKSK